MEQPLFSCAKCFRNFPQSEMSRSGQTCKTCNPHHSTFKQCEFCKSDFKYHICGTVCPRCQSLKTKYGEPQPCSICRLKTAFGNALVCQRCLHYRARFGEPRECRTCGQMCAFLKDEASRQKVDGQVLCWVCTYNFKLIRSRERSDQGNSKRRNESSDTGHTKRQRGFDSHSKHTLSDGYNSLKSESHIGGSQPLPSTQAQSLDSAYNEHLLTISQLQDEIKGMRRQLSLKENELLAKDRTIADLRSELIEMKSILDDRVLKVKASAQTEQDRLMSIIRQLKKENVTASQGMRKRKSAANLLSTPNSLRYSTSAVALFNPDSPLTITSTKTTAAERLLKQEQAIAAKAARRDEILAAIPTVATDMSSSLDDNSNGLSPLPVKLSEDQVTPSEDQVTPSEDQVTLSEDQVTPSEDQVSPSEDQVSPNGELSPKPQPLDPLSSTVQWESSVAVKRPLSSNSSPSVSSGSSVSDEKLVVGSGTKDLLGLDTPSESEEET